MAQSVAGILTRGHQVFLGHRLPGGSLGNKWEFPGGKVEPGESPQDALVREFQEELGLSIDVGPFLCRGHFVHREKSYELLAYSVTLAVEGEPRLLEHQAVAWMDWSDLESLDLADSDRSLLPALRKALSS